MRSARFGERLFALESRERGDLEDAQWTAARRHKYLLRLDCARPLSVDTLVWRAAPDGAFAWRVAITLVEDRDAEDVHPAWAASSPWPDAQDPQDRSISFLGYDVADSGLISGLSNCGYDEEVTELRQRYGPHLNPHHLFAEREPALQFRRVTSERVLEHAPFFVYGLYCLM